MERSDLDAAVTLARVAAGVAADVPVEAWPVHRLDRDAWYVLVRLGRGGEPGWVAAVDPSAGDVMTWAANASGATTVPSPPPGSAAAGLVWQPSRQSRSPLYPLLRVVTPDGDRFVDLAGTVWTGLTGDSRG